MQLSVNKKQTDGNFPSVCFVFVVINYFFFAGFFSAEAFEAGFAVVFEVVVFLVAGVDLAVWEVFVLAFADTDLPCSVFVCFAVPLFAVADFVALAVDLGLVSVLLAVVCFVDETVDFTFVSDLLALDAVFVAAVGCFALGSDLLAVAEDFVAAAVDLALANAFESLTGLAFSVGFDCLAAEFLLATEEVDFCGLSATVARTLFSCLFFKDEPQRNRQSD